MPDIGVVILAAGGSSRLGRPKQLLRFRGGTLVERAVRTALETGCRPVVIVLGAAEAEVRGSLLSAGLDGGDILIAHNERWASGMGSSIRVGLERALGHAPTLSGLLLTLCDQPSVTAKDLLGLLGLFVRTGQQAAAATYGRSRGVIGTPAVFGRGLFDELRALADPEGGRSVLREHPERVATVEMPNAEADIDTESEYAAICSSGAGFPLPGRRPHGSAPEHS